MYGMAYAIEVAPLRDMPPEGMDGGTDAARNPELGDLRRHSGSFSGSCCWRLGADEGRLGFDDDVPLDDDDEGGGETVG